MMKKIISFSLYNQRPKDVLNAVINCFLSKEIYRGWICRFYIDDTIPESIKKILYTFEHVEVVVMPRHIDSEAMLWRFLPASDEDVEVMISRDADSWLSYREFVCVDEFINSDKTFHIIRDHCYHSQKIMGGMWGVKKGVIPEMKTLIESYIKSKNKYDQGFLAEYIYPNVISNALVHVGEQYDIKGNKTNGYFNDGVIPIPQYQDKLLQNVNFDFYKSHSMNQFYCVHCKKNHESFIGAILQNIPSESLIFLKKYFIEKNVETSIIDNLIKI